MNFILLTKTSTPIIGWFSTLLGYIMDAIFRMQEHLHIANLALCIILFTIVVKGLMIPLTISQQKFTRMNAVMNPELQALEKKYKGKSDQDSMMKKNEEMKAIYEKYGVKPSGSCLQMLIQIPIIFGLYQVVANIPAYVTSVKDLYLQIVNQMISVTDYSGIEALQTLATNNGLTVDQLANAENTNKLVDMMYKFDASEWETFKGIFSGFDYTALNEIHKINSFFEFNLGNSPASYGFLSFAILIPIFAGLSQWVSAKIMEVKQKKTPQNNGQNQTEIGNSMAQSMKMMTNIMPIISVVFCWTLPIGMGIYWIVSSLVQIVIQLFVNRYMDKVDVNDLIKKNVDKSNKRKEKLGIPTTKVSTVGNTSLKNIQYKTDTSSSVEDNEKKKNEEQIKKATEYYKNNSPKPGSLASKANMVKQYNEKNQK